MKERKVKELPKYGISKVYKNNEQFGVEDFFYYYKHNRKGKYGLPIFRTILRTFFEILIKEYLLKGFLVRLPGILGIFYIQKYKPKLKVYPNGTIGYQSGMIDWKETRKYRNKYPEAKGHFIFFENGNTDGYSFKLTKSTSKKSIVNTAYNFLASYSLKKEIFKTVTNNNVEFLTTEV